MSENTTRFAYTSNGYPYNEIKSRSGTLKRNMVQILCLELTSTEVGCKLANIQVDLTLLTVVSWLPDANFDMG